VKTLIVCYSISGHTKAVAEEVRAILAADFDSLEDRRRSPGFFGYVKLARDILGKRPPDLAPPKYNPADYDLVILAGPVWSSRMCAPVTSYAMQHRSQFKTTALVCTSRSSEPGYAERSMAGLIQAAELQPVAILGLGHKELKGDHSNEIARFVTAVR
jgi:flavodoxin